MARRTKKASGASEGMQIAKLFKNGRNQAVRLPKEFRFASIVEAYELADPKHPINRHKPPVQKRSFR